jgi:hypothetical protein
MNLWKTPSGSYINLDNVKVIHEHTRFGYGIELIFNVGEDDDFYWYTYKQLGVTTVDEFIQKLKSQTTKIGKLFND